MDIKFAVEAKPSQAKRMFSFNSNLYIVQGEDFCYVTSSKETPGSVKCEVTTRVGSSKNRIDYLYPTTFSVIGLDPRPNHQHQWHKVNGRWERL